MPSPVRNGSYDGSATDGFAITPHDTNLLQETVRMLYVGTPGDVKLVTMGGTSLTFTGASGFLFVMTNRVLSTGTGASNILGLV